MQRYGNLNKRYQNLKAAAVHKRKKVKAQYRPLKINLESGDGDAITAKSNKTQRLLHQNY